MPNPRAAATPIAFKTSHNPQNTLIGLQANSPRNDEMTSAAAAAKFESFPSALDMLMTKHGDTCVSLVRRILNRKSQKEIGLLQEWRSGRSVARRKHSLEFLKRIEKQYALPHGYFARLISHAHPGYRSSPKQLSRFSVELNYQMQLHHDTSNSLASDICLQGETKKYTTITHWKTGKCMPYKADSRVLLERIELHYCLPPGHLSELIDRPEAVTTRALRNVSRSSQGIFSYHLPNDFEQRSSVEQQEIIDWISTNVLGGATEFGKYQSKITRYGFAIVFPEIERSRGGRSSQGYILRNALAKDKIGSYGTIKAPQPLSAEMNSLVAFQTAVLSPVGYSRQGRWSSAMAEKAARDYGIMFGALAAAPLSPTAGHGVSLDKLTLGILAFPSVWDWYLHWRVRRRGFFSVNERGELYKAKAALRKRTGWIRQHPELAKKLRPITGLISSAQIAKARRNWSAVCDNAFNYVVDRIPELGQAARAHRDPFEAILPVLKAEKPLLEYRKIAEEILRLMPDEKTRPFEAALSSRDYLMIRLGMHLGVRQRNLRDLLLCVKDQRHCSTVKLEEMRRGEMRWNSIDQRWEVFIPALAFKNARSSFFKGKPYCLVLPNTAGFYSILDRYIGRHRQMLLNGNPDPGTLFVRSAKTSRRADTYDLIGFYAAWRRVIQLYGIRNPYTGRGAIEGLLPHGPHNIRDVIATHLLKQTGSYELASFAIQDTVEAVVKHYARFLPHEKVARAAEFLNKVWQSP